MKECPYCGRKLKAVYPKVRGGYRGKCGFHGWVDKKWMIDR